MSKNKIKLTICNMPCSLISDDTEDYVLSVGKEVEKAIEDITRQSDRASSAMAAVIVSISFFVILADQMSTLPKRFILNFVMFGCF